MIKVYADYICYSGTTELLEIADMAWINPDQVCSVKPALLDRGYVDILTTDGTRYRVSVLATGLQEIISHEGVSSQIAHLIEMLDNLVRISTVEKDFEVLNEARNT